MNPSQQLRFAPREPLLSELLRGMPVRLLADAAAGDDKAKWVEVAREGTYKGHPKGEFKLDAEIFGQVISNFRKHPSFKKGDDGWGCTDVVAYDFHHESEKSGGQLAVVGAPAQGWVLDLDLRMGADGTAELWALSRFLEPAKSYIAEQKYKWTSVALWPDATHPVTGANIGWYLSSVALTNDPFIQGMVPLAATRRATAFDKPLLADLTKEDGEMAVRELRWIFGLPATAGAEELAAQFAQLEAMATGAADTPVGVDVPNLVCRVRDLLRLPLLTPVTEVLSQARELLGQLGNATPASTEPETQTATLAEQASPPTPPTEETPMHEALLKLARANGWPTTEAELVAKIEADRKLLANGAEKLAAIGKLFGVEDPQAVLDAVSKQHADLEVLKGQIPELAEMLEGKASDEEASAEEDVEEAIATHRLPATAKAALLAMRTGLIELTASPALKTAELKSRLEQRKKAREKFLAEYPLPTRTERHLTASIATEPKRAARGGAARAKGAGYQFRALGGQGGGASRPAHREQPLGPAEGEVEIDLTRYAGNNLVEKAMNYLLDQPGGKDLPYDTVHAQACDIVRDLRAAAH